MQPRHRIAVIACGALSQPAAQIAERRGWRWNIELDDNPDRRLAGGEAIVASSDAWVLDSCRRWSNLLAHVVQSSVQHAWCLDLWEAKR